MGRTTSCSVCDVGRSLKDPINEGFCVDTVRTGDAVHIIPLHKGRKQYINAKWCSRRRSGFRTFPIALVLTVSFLSVPI